jgi:hypothetical protein
MVWNLMLGGLGQARLTSPTQGAVGRRQCEWEGCTKWASSRCALHASCFGSTQ